VIRGGSWNNTAQNARSAYRNRNDPDNRWHNMGFRPVLPVAPQPAAASCCPEQVRPRRPALCRPDRARPFQ
jgi:hypothetical protein